MLTGKYEYLDKKILDYINQFTETHPDFDEERFKLWLETNEVNQKNNPSSYVYKFFTKAYQQGLFLKPASPKIEYIPNTQELFNCMRERGLIVVRDSTIEIDVAMRWLLEKQVVTIEELRDLNNGIIDYLVKNNLTTAKYLDLMMKSNLLKGRFIDWNEIGNIALKEKEEWEAMMLELDQIN